MLKITALLFSVLFLVPLENPVVDHVDIVEVNHFCNQNDGTIVFEQIIWWNFNHEDARYDVVDWRILKDVRLPLEDGVLNKWKADILGGAIEDGVPPLGKWIGGHATPKKMNDGRYVSDWWDEKTDTHRRVVAIIKRDSWSAGKDPELSQRIILPEPMRTRLSPPRPKIATR